MPTWTAIRSRSPNYAALLPTKVKDDDRLSPVDNTHFRRSSAQSEAVSSSSSDDVGYGRGVESLALPTSSGRNARLDSNDHAPAAVKGSQASFSSSVPAKKTASPAKRLSLGLFALKSPMNKSVGGKKGRRLASAQEAEAGDSAPPSSKQSSDIKKEKRNKRQSKEAQTVLQIITGLDTIYLPFTNLSLGSPTTAKATEGKALPDVSSKEIRKLKASLANPKEAPQIVQELKKIPIDSQSLAPSDSVHTNFRTRAVCLECLDSEALDIHPEHAKSPFADQPSPSLTDATKASPIAAKGHSKQTSGADLFTGRFQALSATAADGMPTPGKILGQVATSTGTFSALAGVTGRLIEASGSHEGLISPPCDRMSVLVYWWGYELVLPPPSLAYLGNARSVAGTLFTFLQALAVTGGVPEIAPFVRYISFYIDMEWKAISAQNKGKGVVLAATWVVPVAVVPRPYDLS